MIFIKEAEISKSKDIATILDLCSNIARLLFVDEQNLQQLLKELSSDLKLIDQKDIKSLFCRFYLRKNENYSALEISRELSLHGKGNFDKKVEKITGTKGLKSTLNPIQKRIFEIKIQEEININEEYILGILEALNGEELSVNKLLLLRNKDLLEVLGKLKSNQDELYRANRELQQLTVQLASKNQELTDFTQIVSHDLKEPLGNLNGLLDIVHMKSSKSGLDLDFILNSGRHEIGRMRLFIEKVMEYCNAGLHRRPFVPLNLEEFLDEFFEQHRYGREILFKIDCPISIEYSKAELEIIFNNLIGNSVRYNLNNQVEIFIQQDPENPRHISIRDNGIGIEEKNLKRVFHFGSILSKLGGDISSGVGLALVKRFIEKYPAGEIWAESKVGSGSVFHIVFGKQKKAPRFSMGL